MTEFSGDVITLSSDQQRLRQVAGSQPDFAGQPGIAVALARSGASDSQVASVGGFLRGMDLAKQVSLARQSGVQLNLTDSDRASLTSVNERYDDVDAIQRHAEEQAAQQDTRRGFLGWMEKAANKATTLPGIKQGFHVLDRAADIANMIPRAETHGGLLRQMGVDAGPLNASVFPGQDAQNNADAAGIKQDMTQFGYNPNSVTSSLAFLSRGKQVFSNLDDERKTYGEERVRIAQDYLIDPQGFMDPKLDTAELIRRDKLRRDPQFNDIVKNVDAHRVSAGREIANGFGLDPTGTDYKVVSGSLDAVWSFAYDPTIIGGKIVKGAKVLRYGLPDLADTGRVEALMRGNASVQRGYNFLLDNAKIMRTGTREEKAAAYAAVRKGLPDMAGLVPEINGMGPIRKGVPIDTYDELVKHVVAHDAIARLSMGLAARESPYMPGVLSRYGAARAGMAGRRAANGLKVIDYGRDGAKMLPDEVDGVRPDGSDATGLPDAAELGGQVAAYRKTVRGRLDLIRRKIQLGPESEKISLTDGAAGAETVRRFAALYMPNAHANLMAAKFLAAPLGERRIIAQAVEDQVVHAAGVPTTKGGKKWWADRKLERVDINNSAYDSSGADRDVIKAGEGETQRRAALYDTQISEDYTLPNFREMRTVAAKMAGLEWIVGHTLDTPFVTRAMNMIRTPWLISPASAQRAAIDNDLSAWSQGVGFGSLLKTRLATTAVNSRNIADALKAKGHVEVDEHYRATASTPRGIYRAAIASPARRLMAGLGEKFSSDHLLARAGDIADDQIGGNLEELGKLTEAAAWGGRSVDEGRAMIKMGYKPTVTRLRVGGYTVGGVDGADGAKTWAQQLNLRMSSQLGRKVFEAAVDGDKDGLVAYMKSPGFRDGRAKLERFSTLRDGTAVGDDPALLHRAADELADDQVGDMKALLSSPDGTVHQAVVDHLETGQAVPASMLEGIGNALRPRSVVQPKYVPDLSGGGGLPSNLVQALADGAYHHVVARPIEWMSNTPIYTVNYSRAFDQIARVMAKNNPEVAKWLRSGQHELPVEYTTGIRGTVESSPAWAKDLKELAHQHAMAATVKMIDNPRVQTQLALTTRNFFNFYRAQEDFLRRWGRNLKESPENLRKMQLAVEGGIHSGLVYPDDNGELVFAYPGSGLAIQALAKGLGHFGMHDVNLPVLPNLTTKLNFIQPGLDRPLLPTTSPIASIPVRLARHFAGDQIGLIQGQQILEGDIAPSRSWFSQFLPSPVYRFVAGMSPDDQEGQYASAVRNAFVNADAAGWFSKKDANGKDIPLTAGEADALKQNIRVGVRNHLYMRAALALFIPGAPSNPTEESDASRTNAVERGTFNSVSYKDEFRKMTSEYGFQKAFQIWSTTRPEQLIYTVGTTQGKNGVGGTLSPTQTVLNWMQNNPTLTKDFPSLAAFFAPDAPGDFSDQAWKTELELGLRQHKTLDDFYRDIAVKNAESTYYKARDSRDIAIAKATAAGDDDKVRAIHTVFSAWTDELKKANPLLTEKWAAGSVNTAKIANSIADVERLTKSPTIASVDPNGDLARIVQIYKSRQAYDDTHTGQSNADKAGKDAVDQAYKDFVAKALSRSPYLIPLYQGIFDRVA